MTQFYRYGSGALLCIPDSFRRCWAVHLLLLVLSEGLTV